MSLKLKKNDFVIIISGKNKGKKGRIVKLFKNRQRVIISEINIIKKHQKPFSLKEKGKIIYKEASLHISNICYFCSKMNFFSKIGFKFVKKNKLRFLKRNNMLLKK